MGPRRAEVDRAIAALAARQHGAVAARQLTALGVTARQVRHRVVAGRLHPVHRGVYAVGHPALTTHGRYLAAVLAAGPGAVLSHRSAADLHRIRQQRGRAVEVTAPGRRRDRPGIRVHESRTLAGNVTLVHGIPVTTVARTLVDLADVVVPTAVDQALATAERLGLIDRDQVEAAPGRRRVVRGAHVFTRSKAEAALNAQFPEHGIRPPEVNQDVGPWEVDFLWRAEKVVLELDFYETHKGRYAYRRDRVKTAWLEDRGYRVLREPGEDLDVRKVCARVRQRLGVGAAR